MIKLITPRLIAATILLLIPTTSHAKDWYMGGSIGYNKSLDQTSINGNDAIETEFDAGIVTTSFIGLRLDQNRRIEVEFSWRKNDGNSLSFNGVEESFSAKGAQSYGGSINAYYDFANETSFTPYLGAGIGFDYIENEFLFRDVVFEDDDFVFAWQVSGGVSTPVTDKIDGFIGLRYHSANNPAFEFSSPVLNKSILESEYDNFSISVGYRYKFN